MIEINLLPEDLRQAEGTPLPRLVAIMASVVVACGLGVLCAFYYMVYIPRAKQEIAQRDEDIKGLKVRKAEVDAIDAQIAVLIEKVAALDNLNQGRMRYGRLLDKLTNTVPEGVWYTSFGVGPDANPLPAGVVAGGGKRYMIALAGISTGTSEVEKDKKITETFANIMREFSVAKEEWHGKPGETPPPLYGYSKELGAKFYRPELKDITTTTVPVPQGPDWKPEVVKQVNIPKDGLSFRLELHFEMPPPKTGG